LSERRQSENSQDALHLKVSVSFLFLSRILPSPSHVSLFVFVDIDRSIDQYSMAAEKLAEHSLQIEQMRKERDEAVSLAVEVQVLREKVSRYTVHDMPP
jgi:hypothetical protein